MPSAVESELALSESTQEGLRRMAMAMGMTGDELASTVVEAVATAIVKACKEASPPPANVIPFPLKK